MRVDTNELYQQCRKSLIDNQYPLLKESLVGGRPISVFDLPSFVFSKTISFDTLLELSAPKSDHNYSNGRQHIELVYSEKLEQLLHDYPEQNRDFSGFDKPINRDISIMFDDRTEVKFHENSLRTVLSFEK